MPTKSKTVRVYAHPALARLLKRGGACASEAAKAVVYASRYPTLAAAVKSMRGWNGDYRACWLSHLGDRDGHEKAADCSGYTERKRAFRANALAIAGRLDRARARGRKAAGTRARLANRV